ncbi:MAG: PT domain-containing protein, partial [Chloroflexota bacterium]
MRKFVIWLVVFLSVVSAVQAQDDSRQLRSGQPVSGNIDTHHLTQMYSFTSKLPFANGLRLENTGALPLKIVIIDSAGIPLITVDDIEPGTEGRLKSWLPPTDGTYYVVIYPTESLNDREGIFTLTLDDVPFTMAATTEATEIATTLPTAIPTAEATAQPTEIATIESTTQPTEIATTQPTEIPTEILTTQPTVIPTMEPTTQPTAIPTEVPTAQPTVIPTIEATATPIIVSGLYFELEWRTGVRMSLEIRDPQGQSVHWNSTT